MTATASAPKNCDLVAAARVLGPLDLRQQATELGQAWRRSGDRMTCRCSPAKVVLVALDGIEAAPSRP